MQQSDSPKTQHPDRLTKMEGGFDVMYQGLDYSLTKCSKPIDHD